MSTQTRERNFKKNPHTAHFLQVFHSANGANNTAEAHAAEEDLLDSVPVGQGFTPSTAQQLLISKLVSELADLDGTAHRQAVEYNIRMDYANGWTQENTSRWIGNLIAKVRELRAAAPAPKTATPAVQVADGRYAVEEEGTLRFFKVKNGRKAGFVFLDIQASDEWHSIRNLGRIRTVLALIAQDAKAAMIRYGQELGECGHCGRTLTDPESRAAGIGPICAGR